MDARATRSLLALSTALLLATSATALGPAPAGAQATPTAAGRSAPVADPDVAAQLEAVRRATERFRDVEVAMAEGYVPDPTGMCVEAGLEGYPRQLGGMGIHYFRPDLLGLTATEPPVSGTGTHTDFTEPGVLVYVPDGEGQLELGAVENLVFAEAWHAAGHEGRPEFLGNEYFQMVENPETEAMEAHGFAPHYELHVWLHRENPAGMFMPFNPAVSCPSPAAGAGHATHEAHAGGG